MIMDDGMVRLFGVLGAVLALLAVALGAFGAHALEGRLEPRALEVFEIGIRYQTTHALALLLVVALAGHLHGGLAVASGWLFIMGTLVFSGSLYLLAITGVGRLGMITPLGGLAFLAGWALLAGAFLRG